jgi:transcriptional regulator with XRE-family HTH domain
LFGAVLGGIENGGLMPRVFLSYSHEETEHDQWVMDLGKLLRSNGVDAYLDKWGLLPGQDTTYFMESQIRDSDFVILVCTPVYAEKSNIPRGGVGYEKNIISAEMLQANDLRPKFIPVLRKGTFESALPIYLGSKYAIDFREEQDQQSALDELLRAIYKQPHPEKPSLGRNPFDTPVTLTVASSNIPVTASDVKLKVVQQDQDVRVWAKEALGRFEYLRASRLNKEKEDPFLNGFWQASFVLLSKPDVGSLQAFLEKLRASETHRTGWDIGWVPTRSGIAPYPYQGGIEVWLAEDGDKGPAYSDFWRAEPSGRFVFFRGYQEDDTEFRERLKLKERIIDYSLFLWRVSEVLLYIESFAKQILVEDSVAVLKIVWTALENRRIGNHKALFDRLYENYICRQEMVDSVYTIPSCAGIKKNLIHDVKQITEPLFEAFDFFSVPEEDIKENIAKLFDPEKEGV